MTKDESSISDSGMPQSSVAGAISANGYSTSEVQWDVNAALQLLANRACYITGATNAMIAVGEGETLVCKASSGTNANEPGSQVQIDGGLTSELMAECVATQQPVRCDNAEADDRISLEEGVKQGVGSVLIAPLIHGNEVVGIFQLTAGRKSAFEEREVSSLLRLVAAAQTALEGALAKDQGGPGEAKPATSNSLDTPTPSAGGYKFSSIALRTGRIPLPQSRVAQALAENGKRLSRGQELRRCEGCGFPISIDRRLCVDCEAAEIAHGRFVEPSPALYPFVSENKQRNWLDEHFYTIGIVLVSVLTMIVLFLWAR